MDLAWRLARKMGDGCFHSGEALAAEFRVSRSTIWNAMRALRKRGLELHAVRGKGYWLAAPVDWLDRDRILAALGSTVRDRVRIELLSEADSTNDRLLAVPPPPTGTALACLAEYQSGGRGRSGRRWLSPPGAGICLSVAWQFDRPPHNLSALSILAGLGAREALLDQGVPGVALKWPNDLLAETGKLGGLLVELRAEGNGPCHAVIGVGVNYRLPAILVRDVEAQGGLAPVDLATVCHQELPERNPLAAALIECIIRRLDVLTIDGAGDLVNEWEAADALHGRIVTVEIGNRKLTGRALGIDSDGALRLEREGRIQRITAGDVRVRPG